MRRHELDVVSLLGGLFFVLVAAGFLVAEASDLRLDPEWVGPGILVALGAVGLVAVSVGARERPAVDEGGPEDEGGRVEEGGQVDVEDQVDQGSEPVTRPDQTGD